MNPEIAKNGSSLLRSTTNRSNSGSSWKYFKYGLEAVTKQLTYPAMAFVGIVALVEYVSTCGKTPKVR